MNWTPKVRQKTFGVQFFFATSSFQRFPPVVCKRNTDFSRFFMFRRPTTSCFQCFLRFVGWRRAVFSVFSVSSADNGRFSAISAFRSRATNGFQRFLPVACKRNAVFGNFRRKTTSDSLFSAFFARRLQAKRYFRRFLHFVHERWTIFRVFSGQ